MADRSADRLWQAERDLNHAKNAAEDRGHEWACFAAQQAGEKASKALYQSKHMEGWGHVILKLVEGLAAHVSAIPERVYLSARALDKLYVPTRYPNGFAQGAPGQFYDAGESRKSGTGEPVSAFRKEYTRGASWITKRDDGDDDLRGNHCQERPQAPLPLSGGHTVRPAHL